MPPGCGVEGVYYDLRSNKFLLLTIIVAIQLIVGITILFCTRKVLTKVLEWKGKRTRAVRAPAHLKLI